MLGTQLLNIMTRMLRVTRPQDKAIIKAEMQPSISHSMRLNDEMTNLGEYLISFPPSHKKVYLFVFFHLPLKLIIDVAFNPKARSLVNLDLKVQQTCLQVRRQVSMYPGSKVSQNLNECKTLNESRIQSSHKSHCVYDPQCIQEAKFLKVSMSALLWQCLSSKHKNYPSLSVVIWVSYYAPYISIPFTLYHMIPHTFILYHILYCRFQ